MKSIIFDWADVAGGKAAKKAAQMFGRAGTNVISATSDNKVRRSSGVSFKTLNFTFVDGQQVSMTIKEHGDVATVSVNGSILPIKNQDDHAMAVAEISKALEANRAKFQAKQAKVRVELPKGLKTAAPKIEVALKTRVDELDSEIAAKTAQRDELVAELGPVMDAVEPVEQVEPMESVEPVENAADAVVLDAAKWSADVDTDWHPKEGFFTQSADEIASGLKSASKDLAQAMARLNFYINRAGDNLSGDDKARLESAKDKLSALYDDKTMDNVAVVEGLKECDADVNVRVTITDDREAIVQPKVLTASGDPAVTGTPLVDSDGLVTEQTIDDKFEDEFEILEPGEDSDVPELVLT